MGFVLDEADATQLAYVRAVLEVEGYTDVAAALSKKDSPAKSTLTAVRSSVIHRDILGLVQSTLGLDAQNEHPITVGTGLQLTADLYLPLHSANRDALARLLRVEPSVLMERDALLIEVDGPQHFTDNIGANPVTSTFSGAAALRERLLRSLPHRFFYVSIKSADWNRVKTNSKAALAHLLSRTQ